MAPCAVKFVPLPCCTVILVGHSAVIAMRCSDSTSVHWGNPEHSVSLNDTPVSTHDKQHTHTHTNISVCQAQPSSRFLPHPPNRSQSCKYICCLLFFCLGKMTCEGGTSVCTDVCVCVYHSEEQ